MLGYVEAAIGRESSENGLEMRRSESQREHGRKGVTSSNESSWSAPRVERYFIAGGGELAMA